MKRVGRPECIHHDTVSIVVMQVLRVCKLKVKRNDPLPNTGYFIKYSLSIFIILLFPVPAFPCLAHGVSLSCPWRTVLLFMMQITSRIKALSAHPDINSNSRSTCPFIFLSPNFIVQSINNQLVYTCGRREVESVRAANSLRLLRAA